MDWLGLGLRWLHIMAAITAAGGAIFCCCALAPGLCQLSPDARAEAHSRIRPKWAMLVGISILVLLVTGLINFFRTLPLFEGEEFRDTKRLYNIVWGVKFLLGMIVFFLASALSGRSPAFDKLRQNGRIWLTVNVLLIAVIVALSGVLRSTHNQPAAPVPAAPSR